MQSLSLDDYHPLWTICSWRRARTNTNTEITKPARYAKRETILVSLNNITKGALPFISLRPVHIDMRNMPAILRDSVRSYSACVCVCTYFKQMNLFVSQFWMVRYFSILWYGKVGVCMCGVGISRADRRAALDLFYTISLENRTEWCFSFTVGS